MTEAPAPGIGMTLKSSLADLQAIVGTRWVRAAPTDDSVSVDGIQPSIAVAPGSYEEVAAVMRYANDRRLAVIPLGGGTTKHTGNAPRQYDLALVLSRLNAIIEYEPADLTVTCQAGITVTDLQTRLSAAGQAVSLDVWLPKQPSVGGMLAANASGPTTAAYGSPRDFTIGLRVVTADGRLTRVGGRVVKNVAGYDLTKLYVGSFGTLAVIVEATLRVIPTPRAKRDAMLYIPELADAYRLGSELYRRRLAVSYVQLLGTVGESESKDFRTTAWTLNIGLAGSEPAVARSAIELQRLTSDSGGSPVEGDWPGGPAQFEVGGTNGIQLVCLFNALPSKLTSIIGQLQEFGSPQIVAEPGTGKLRAYWHADASPMDVLKRSREIAVQQNATCVIEYCDPAIKRQIDIFGDIPPKTLDLMRRIKQQFDPNGILSPGRFVGKL